MSKVKDLSKAKWVLLIMLISSHCFATIREPDNIIYGSLAAEIVSVSIEVAGVSIATYRKGDNPDVDAIYRLTAKLPIIFEKNNTIALGSKTWCPFNSQNTTWFKPAFPLLSPSTEM